ncbi:hypothetical protein SAY86_022594 [Trapa natans]|uniref:Pentatricopeptide repeat-containing protein n=1 Tax=Trapa natans TaxID=22666 RepID=A0AAN7LUL2_TRANT|nr:hypothetical protein SAY86_022594 [Trapa natans]
MGAVRLLGYLSKTHSPTILIRSLVTTVHGPSPSPDSGGGEDADKILKILVKTGGDGCSDSKVKNSLDRTAVTVSPALVTEVVKRLSNAGALALSFFRWAEKQRGFQYSSQSYNALIEALGKIKQFTVAWALIGDMHRRGLLTKDTFALISRRYARARKVKEAVEAFNRMEKFGLRYDSADFNRLIDILCKSRSVAKAQEVFDNMKKSKRFELDVKSYTMLLEGWGQEKNLPKVMEVYGEMNDVGLVPDVVTYGIIIDAYCKDKKYNDAIKLFDEMLERGCEPTPHIYCTLINGLGSGKKLSEAIGFFERMKASGITPTIPTYNALIGAYCWSEKIADAHRVIEEMRNLGNGPNSRTYDIILHHLIRARKTKEAYELFQRMGSEGEAPPMLSTYEIVMRMFCNEGRVDMALRVWEQMKSCGFLPGMQMFSMLILSLCDDNRLDEACNYFQEMLDVGIRPPANMFSKLKQSLIDQGKNDKVLSLGKRIDDLRKIPLLGGAS